MPSEYSPTGSRRSSRRRRPGRTRSSFNPEPPAPPKKKSLWEVIVGFFRSEPPKKASSSTPTRAPSDHPTRTSDRPARAERPAAERRKPEVVEVTSPRIYVGNLSFDATESDLFELFSGVGSVRNVEVVANRHTQRSKGFAFVEMQSVDEATRAVSELHDKEYMGRKLVVSGAKAVEERTRSRQPEQ